MKKLHPAYGWKITHCTSIMSFPDLIGESRPIDFFRPDYIGIIPDEVWLKIVRGKF